VPESVYAHRGGKATAYRYNLSPVPRSSSMYLDTQRRGGTVGILSWIVFGLIAGIIAKLLMPGRDPGGCIITMLLGVAGAFVGGFLYRLVTGTQVLYFGFDFRSFAIAVVGAVVVLAVYRLVLGR
jgi:uncharacterized membrane protein YeaQ/YmgE (transglycosylase-associated protein family)